MRSRGAQSMLLRRLTSRAFASESLYTKTPYLFSPTLSKPDSLGKQNVWLKMDALQPSGSFKDRGISHLCKTLKSQNVTKVVSSSGGNAGLAVANSGRVLGMDVEVIVPQTTKDIILKKLSDLGAHVQVHGKNWNEANDLALEIVASNANAAFIHPFDHPIIWQGHASLIHEIAETAETSGGHIAKPDAIVASVGGGGLLCGVLQGLADVGWEDVAVVAVETQGAASFASAYEAADPTVCLPAIDSIATSLGALQVCSTSVEHAARHPGGVHTAVVSDAEAVDACASFLSDHRLLVEPACAAALSLFYNSGYDSLLRPFRDVAVVVCGGSGVDPEILRTWQSQLNSDSQ